MKWQTIETAPKNGQPVLVFTDEFKITSAQYDTRYLWWEILVPSEGYRDSDCVTPTHWMPLPEPPTEAQ